MHMFKSLGKNLFYCNYRQPEVIYRNMFHKEYFSQLHIKNTPGILTKGKVSNISSSIPMILLRNGHKSALINVIIQSMQ